MELTPKESGNIYVRLGIPFYKRPAFASIVIGTLSLGVILITQRYLTRYMDAEIGLVTEISVATICMFALFIVVNHLQSSVSKKELEARHTSTVEEMRNEFTHIASRDIAEASTAIKWGVRTLEPAFEALDEHDRETLYHIRDRNDHILDIVRNLVILARIERKEIIVSHTPTNITGVIENVIATASRRTKAHGSQVIFVPPPEQIVVETDHVILSDILQSLYSYCLDRTRGAADAINIRAFTIQSEGSSIARIVITDNAPPVAEHIRKNIFARAIRNPHTGELENTSLGPHVAQQLAQLLGVELLATTTDEQTSFSLSFLPIADKNKN